MPRDLDTLTRQFAENPRGEQPQAGAREELGRGAHRGWVTGQGWDGGVNWEICEAHVIFIPMM